MTELELLLFCDLNDRSDTKREAAEACRKQPYSHIRLG